MKDNKLKLRNLQTKYSFPQDCIPYRLSVGRGLFTNFFLD